MATSPLVTAHVRIVDTTGRWLVIRDKSRAIRWTLPGGGVPADEWPANTAARMTIKQTGLHRSITGLLAVGWTSGTLALIFDAAPLEAGTIWDVMRPTDCQLLKPDGARVLLPELFTDPLRSITPGLIPYAATGADGGMAFAGRSALLPAGRSGGRWW
jgi:hypothetical protein